jgi:uncharacterized protein (DUF1778 family)
MGRSLSDFIVASVCERAARTVRDHQAITLGARDRKIFVAALLKPPAPDRASARRRDVTSSEPPNRCR